MCKPGICGFLTSNPATLKGSRHRKLSFDTKEVKISEALQLKYLFLEELCKILLLFDNVNESKSDFTYNYSG